MVFMYKNVYFCRKKSLIHLWDDEIGYLCENFVLPFYVLDKNGSHRSIYDEPLSRIVGNPYQWINRGVKVYQSDVSHEMIYLINRYGDADNVSVGHNVVYLDIEVSTDSELPNVETAKNKITAISFCSSIGNEEKCFVLDETKILENKTVKGFCLRRFDDEKELIESFLVEWSKQYPTILSGWNTASFDIPYLVNRIEKVLGKSESKRLSPIGALEWNENEEKHKIAGISHLDYLRIFRDKKFVSEEKKSYKLDDITKEYLGKGKVQYEGSLEKLYKENLEKYIEYNLNDVRLVKELDEKMKFIDLIKEIAHVCKVPYEDVFMASRFIEGAILTLLRKKKLIAPNRPSKVFEETENAEQEESEEEFLFESTEDLGLQKKNKLSDKRKSEDEKAIGAYVKIPKKGIYDWVYDLDLESMYPSILRTLNISPETKVGKIENYQEVLNVLNEESESDFFLNDLPAGFILKIEMRDGSKKNVSKERFIEVFKSRKFYLARNGVIYDGSKKGIIPEILDEWFQKRKEYKKMMVEYGNQKDNEKYEYYRRRQLVYKVMLNSCYGVLLLKSFRFYDKDNGEAITLTGQFIIKSTDKQIRRIYEEFYGNLEKDPVIYMDTDSAFIDGSIILKNQESLSDEETSKLIEQLAHKVQEKINLFYDVFSKRYFNVEKHHFRIKQEYVARRAFFISKKHYAQWIIFKEGVKKDEFDIKGIETIKSDFPKIFSDFSRKIIVSILKGSTNEEINEEIIRFKSQLKNFSLDEVAKPTSVKNFDKFRSHGRNSKKCHKWLSFLKGTPSHVKAAFYYNYLICHYGFEKNYSYLKNREKIKWVYLKPNPYGFDNIAFRGYDDPTEIIKFAEKYVDNEKMYNRLLKNKFEKFYEALGWIYPSEEITERLFE